MDNLFGKDDSGNDSDPADIDEKIEQTNCTENNQTRPKGSRDGMDGDDLGSPIKNESVALSSNREENEDASEAMQEEVNSIDIVKHELDTNGRDESNNSRSGYGGNAFDHATVLTHSIPMTLKERRESKERTKRELEEEEREKMQVLVSNFTEDQLDRYEMYRRAAFPKAAIKRIMQTITGCSVSQNVVIAMSGIAKVFVGEIVEEALDVMETNEETGPLQPKHLREAVRRLRLQGQIPNGRAHKSFFRL